MRTDQQRGVLLWHNNMSETSSVKSSVLSICHNNHTTTCNETVRMCNRKASKPVKTAEPIPKCLQWVPCLTLRC